MTSTTRAQQMKKPHYIGIAVFTLIAGCSGMQTMSEKELGIAKSNVGEYREALIHFNKALKKNQDDWELWFNSALMNQKLEEHEQAIKDIAKSIEYNRNNPSPYLLSSTSKKAVGDFAGQESDLKKAIEVDPRFAVAYINLGNIFRDNYKENEKAISYYSKAISILDPGGVSTRPDKNLALAHSNRGVAYQRTGSLSKACKDAKRASSLGSIMVKQFLEKPEGAWCKNMNPN